MLIKCPEHANLVFDKAAKHLKQYKNGRKRRTNSAFGQNFGRSEGIRTPDILLPKQARYQLRYTPIYLVFCFTVPANFGVTIRGASLKNIVVLLAWSASHYSLFFHLRASPVSSAGRGEPLRPTALHPDLFVFLFYCTREFRCNSPRRFPQKHSRTARLERVALLLVFSSQGFACFVRRTRRISSPNCATPRFIWFFVSLHTDNTCVQKLRKQENFTSSARVCQMFFGYFALSLTGIQKSRFGAIATARKILYNDI